METCAGRYLPCRRFFSVRLIMNGCAFALGEQAVFLRENGVFTAFFI